MAKMKHSYFPQIYAAVSACLGALSLGTILGYSSPAGPILLEGSDSLLLSEAQNVWVSSIITIGAIVGCPLGGIAMKIFGRRFSLIWSVVPYLFGWVLIAAAQTFSMILIGRFISGVCIGLTCVIVPMFIGEFATPDIRGSLTSLLQLMCTAGTLFVYLLGAAFSSFRWIAAVCGTTCVAHCITLVFCRESPTYLLMKGRKDEAKEALQFYRGKDYEVTKELEAIQSSIDNTKETTFKLSEFRKPMYRKPLIIAMALQFFQQASGVNAVIFNLVTIFRDAQISLSPNQCSIIVGSVLVGMTAVSAVLVEKVGRKVLLMLSSGLMTLSLIPLGAYFFMKSQIQEDEEAVLELSNSLGWLPLTSMIFYIATFSIGYGSIPWVVMGEVFTPDARDSASSIATVCNWITCFAVTSSFVFIQNSIGSHGAYWGYAVICGLNFLFCTFVVPETRGKSIEEITASFDKATRKNADTKSEA